MAEMLTYAPDLRVDDRRPGRVHAGVPALRGDPGAPGAEGRRDKAREEEAAGCSACRAMARLAGRRVRSACDLTVPLAWLVPATSARTSSTSPATSAAARCCAASTPSTSWPAAQRRQVCELCTARAQHEGWIRESGADELALRHAAPRGPRALVPRAPARAAASARARSPTRSRAGGRRAAAATPRAREPRARAAPPEPPRRPRHVRAVPTNAELKMQRALEVFNASEHTRTVGGVARSLGAPGGVRAPARRPPERGRDHGHVGAVAGTASRSTSPTRPAACAGTRRATSCPSSTPDEREVNAAADERGGLHLRRSADMTDSTDGRVRRRTPTG